MSKSALLPRSKKMLAALLLVVVASVGLGVAGDRFIRSPEQVAADAAAPPRTLITAEVTRGRIDHSVSMAGTVALGNKIDVTTPPPAGVASVVTKHTLAQGDQVLPGSVLLEVSYRPVIVLPGTAPLIRDLKIGDKGPDVMAIQQSLREVGLPVLDPSGTFGASTGRAIASLYQDAGYTVPTGTKEDKPLGPRALTSELVVVPSLPGRLVDLRSPVGAVTTDVLASVTTARVAVLASTSVSDASNLKKGLDATLKLSDSADTATGTISSVGAPTQADGGQGFEVRVRIRVDSDFPLKMVGGDVQVNVNTTPGQDPGLIVPITGVQTAADGTTFVSRLRGTKPVRVPVDITDTGGGAVKVTTDARGALAVGDLVVTEGA